MPGSKRHGKVLLMCSEIAVSVENLSKCYQIYDQPRDRLKQFVLPKIQNLTGQAQKKYFREFWALNDVSFEVKKGETVGIIGRNGSGKSTLLQMICGTLNPTSGSIKTKGRIAALLELGSGFNPEFTGKENVYLNGAVLGLSKEEIDQRFHKIEEFADIGEFLEQPVKTYSSGMMVRLAFAVIAHVDADILVVDEALAVGDAIFTQKCMRFIRKFKESGTLLFVSHDMSSVLNLCERALWLDTGQNRKIGQSKEVSEAYLQYTLQELYGQETELETIKKRKDSSSYSDELDRDNEKFALDYKTQLIPENNFNEANGWQTGAGEIVDASLKLADDGMVQGNVLTGGELVKMIIKAVAHQDMDRPILGFLVRDRLGQDLFGENTLPFSERHPLSIKAGESIRAEFTFKLPMLPNGDYTVMTSLADGNLHNHVQHHWLHNALILHVNSSKVRFGLVGVEFKKIKFEKS